MRMVLLLLALSALMSLANARLSLADPTPDARAAAMESAGEDAAREPAPAPAIEAHAPTPFAPLFRAAAAPASTDEPRPGEHFALVGLVGEGAQRMAYFRDEADGRTLSARAGENVAGWTVDRIEDRCADLRRARRRQQTCM